MMPSLQVVQFVGIRSVTVQLYYQFYSDELQLQLHQNFCIVPPSKLTGMLNKESYV